MAISIRFDMFFFFFQAEDGIRDWSVTGVQTCALPISAPPRAPPVGSQALEQQYVSRLEEHAAELAEHFAQSTDEIGRASCRERVEISGGAVSVKKKKRGRSG